MTATRAAGVGCARLVKEGDACCRKVTRRLAHVLVLLECSQAQRAEQLLRAGAQKGRQHRWRLRRPRDATRLGHGEARQQPLKVDTAAQRAQPPRLQRAAREAARSSGQSEHVRRASALFAVPGGPMSSKCSPHTTESSSRRT